MSEHGPMSLMDRSGQVLVSTLLLAVIMTGWAEPSFARPAGDYFRNRVRISGSSGWIFGNNTGASRERGEPYHASRSGGRSVWWTWTAPGTGIVTFDTRGSTFDTLLAVYVGTSVNRLSRVTSDDDISSRVPQSEVRFRAQEARVYQIAVDGYRGATGAIVMSWRMSSPTNPGQNPTSGFPAEVRPSNRPQAGGSDRYGVEVAGAGTTQYVFARNRSSSTVTYRAGNWFEPKDGRYQRMIITRTTSIRPGYWGRIPTACMQRGKPAPARGIRFFSREKRGSGSVQQCQIRCLTRQSGIQDCVWGCERQSVSRTGGTSTLVFSIRDSCNDGYRINYRYHGYSSSGDRVSQWPAGGNIYFTPRYNQVYTKSLTCNSSVQWICFGGETGRRTWGVGLDGTGNRNLCYRCPTSGTARTRTHGLSCP